MGLYPACALGRLPRDWRRAWSPCDEAHVDTRGAPPTGFLDEGQRGADRVRGWLVLVRTPRQLPKRCDHGVAVDPDLSFVELEGVVGQVAASMAGQPR